MRLTRKTLINLIGSTILVAVMVVPWLRAERRWADVNNPAGKFTAVVEYLATGRLPSRVTTLSVKGENYWIAYGPMDHGEAIPSGPAAYVFDATGRLIAWSHDTGDDRSFQQAWPLALQQEASLADLRKFGRIPE
jgi:hypothetical protein